MIELIESRAWYPLCAILLTYAIAAWRRWGDVTCLPARWQWVPAVAVAAAGAVVDAAAAGEPWPQALGLAAYAALSVGLPAIGWHHTSKRIAGAA